MYAYIYTWICSYTYIDTHICVCMYTLIHTYAFQQFCLWGKAWQTQTPVFRLLGCPPWGSDVLHVQILLYGDMSWLRRQILWGSPRVDANTEFCCHLHIKYIRCRLTVRKSDALRHPLESTTDVLSGRPLTVNQPSPQGPYPGGIKCKHGNPGFLMGSDLQTSMNSKSLGHQGHESGSINAWSASCPLRLCREQGG